MIHMAFFLHNNDDCTERYASLLTLNYRPVWTQISIYVGCVSEGKFDRTGVVSWTCIVFALTFPHEFLPVLTVIVFNEHVLSQC